MSDISLKKSNLISVFKALYVIVVITSILAISCSFTPRPRERYYKPLNEGQKTDMYNVAGRDNILIYELGDGVVTRVFIWSSNVNLYEIPTPSLSRFPFLQVAFEVPEGQEIKLASDTFEIQSEELVYPIIAKVVSIQEIAGGEFKYYYKWWKPIGEKMGAYEELSGHRGKKLTYYVLNFVYEIKDTPIDNPTILTVIFPKIYIGGELDTIETLKFKSKKGYPKN